MTRWSLVTVLALSLLGAGCGGSTPAPTPVVPAATVTAIGEGALVIHPSADGRFSAALETPVRVRETTGGSATWNFARMSLLSGTKEIERAEIGQDTIAAAGYGTVAANSNALVTLYFHFNTSDFTNVTITFGMTDKKDSRALNVDVPFTSFTAVNISLVPKRWTPNSVTAR